MRKITKKLHSFEYNNTTPNPVTRKNKHPQATSLSFGSEMRWTFFFFLFRIIVLWMVDGIQILERVYSAQKSEHFPSRVIVCC